FAWYGCELEVPEQKRRYLIKSLLRADGLDERAYEAWAGAPWTTDFPALVELLDHDLAVRDNGIFRLTKEGLERADTIGPWLYSDAMTSRMEDYELV
ncbi:MAG TPA: hypothetical protein VGE67_15580, partial [Haloferula sp.]